MLLEGGGKEGVLISSFPFKNIADKANFSDYKWLRSNLFSGEKNSTPYTISENLFFSLLKNANSP